MEGHGRRGACHPRDNIALRYMSNELDLGYDLFDAVMHPEKDNRKYDNFGVDLNIFHIRHIQTKSTLC